MTAQIAPTAPFLAGLTPGGAAARGPVSGRVLAAGAAGTAHRTPHSSLRPVSAAVAGRAGRSGARTPHCGVGSAVSGAVLAGCGGRSRGTVGAVAGAGTAACSRRLSVRVETRRRGLTWPSYPALRHRITSYESAPQPHALASVPVGMTAAFRADRGFTLDGNARRFIARHGRSMAIGSECDAMRIAFSALPGQHCSAEFGELPERLSAAGSARRSAVLSAPGSERHSAEFGPGFGAVLGSFFGGPGTGRSDRYSGPAATGTVGTIRAVDSATIRKEA